MTRPQLLDLFCCAGGAAMGYYQAGFDVIGVDIAPQPHYPFPFIRADALDEDAIPSLRSFDAIHASPPCQRYTKAQRIRGREHPDLVAETRELLSASGKPYIIENVPGAPLKRSVILCGSMFPELRVYRHREFETNWSCAQPPMVCAGNHHPNQAKMGRAPKPGQFVHVVGNFSGVAYAREAMGIDWMTRDELREAIPPAYTRFIGAQLLTSLEHREAA